MNINCNKTCGICTGSKWVRITTTMVAPTTKSTTTATTTIKPKTTTQNKGYKLVSCEDVKHLSLVVFYANRKLVVF